MAHRLPLAARRALRYDRPMSRWAAYLLLTAAVGCETRCDQVFDKQEADWCYAKETVDAGQRGDLGRAQRLLDQIGGRKVRAIATDQLIASRPPGLEREQALALCGELMEHWQLRCQEAWSDPALWVQP